MKRNKNQQLEKERQRMDTLNKEVDAYRIENDELKQQHRTSMALSLHYEERIDAIKTELSEMEVKRLIKDAQGLIVNDTHCRKCRDRPIEYAVAPCFHFAYCKACAAASYLNECVICGENITRSQKMYLG